MHREFRKLLEGATSVSKFVIAVNLDIRGFSSFSKKVESPEAAVFIKRVYMRLIDDYFTSASFLKPTGDGLLITIPYTEANLPDVAKSTVDCCLKVLTDFGTLCSNDPMINFEVPTKVGIGLSRGAACGLVSEDKILDYSGKPLNVASRLMDFARPTGIVMDAAFGLELLSNEQRDLFVEDSIYVKGIAERESFGIYYTKDVTIIPPQSKQPLDKPTWRVKEDNKTLKEIRQISGLFIYDLPTIPIDPNTIAVKVTHPKVVKGRIRKGLRSFVDFKSFTYYLQAGKPCVRVHFGELAKLLETAGVKSSWTAKIEIMYVES